MDRVVAARKLIGDLVKADLIQVRRVEIVGRDLVKLLDTLKRPPSGQELGEWLEEHPQVEDLAASSAILDELSDRYLQDPTATFTEARNSDLEGELRQEPDNVTPYLVYADWLQERGDPLGELIALGVASAKDGDVARFERHLKRHQVQLLGGELDSRVELRWRFGFVQSIDAVGELDIATWQRLLGLRVCELVESITLHRACPDAVATAIAAAAPGSLQALTLDAVVAPLPAPLLRRPLRSLAIRPTSSVLAIGRDTLPPSLERLEISNGDTNLAFLSRAELPRLAHLTLDLIKATVELLHLLRVPALTHLVVRGGDFDAAMLHELATLPFAAQLRSLGLVDLGLDDETIAQLAATRGFSSLEEVDVSHNELTRTGLDSARSLAPTVISTRQHRRGHTAEKRARAFAGSRLQAAEEIADPAAWRRAGIDGDIRWARYRGDADYELFVSTDLSRYGCTCPSSIQPCKHVVALALLGTRVPLPTVASHGIELRVTTRASLDNLLEASLDPED